MSIRGRDETSSQNQTNAEPTMCISTLHESFGKSGVALKLSKSGLSKLLQ